MRRSDFWRVSEINTSTILLVFFILLAIFFLFKPKISFAQTQEYALGPLPFMALHTESVKEVSTSTAKIIWFTSHKATSKVIYDTKSLQDNKLKLDENYGYLYTSETDFNGVTYHEVILANLEPNTTYYLRAISLPDIKKWPGARPIYGKELTFTTKPLPKSAKEETGTGGPVEETKSEEEVKPLAPLKPSKSPALGRVLGQEVEREELLQDSATITEEEVESIVAETVEVGEEVPEVSHPANFINWLKELFWWIVLALVVGILIYSWPERKK